MSRTTRRKHGGMQQSSPNTSLSRNTSRSRTRSRSTSRSSTRSRTRSRSTSPSSTRSSPSSRKKRKTKKNVIFREKLEDSPLVLSPKELLKEKENSFYKLPPCARLSDPNVVYPCRILRTEVSDAEEYKELLDYLKTVASTPEQKRKHYDKIQLTFLTSELKKAKPKAKRPRI